MRWASRTFLSCVAALLLAGSAHAQDVTRARLLTVPDAQMLSDHFPPVALVTAVSGRVVLVCDVAINGESECRAAEEVPAAMSFGAAAEAVARDWHFSPGIENGAPVASQVRIPIEFSNENTEPFAMQGELQVDAARGAAPVTDSSTDLPPEELDGIICGWARRDDCFDERPRRVRARDMNSRYYPAAALAANFNGRALVACAVRSSGNADCALEREMPAGAGFGEHAVSLVSDVVAAGRDQLGPGSAIRVPVDFALHAPRARPTNIDRWSQVPTGGVFSRYYPRNALERGIDGTVVLICAIRADRRLNCEVNQETPLGHGFGLAARQISLAFELSEEMLGQPGLAVGDRMFLPIRFNVG